MTAHTSPAHLAERAAQLLKQSGGLGGTERLLEGTEADPAGAAENAGAPDPAAGGKARPEPASLAPLPRGLIPAGFAPGASPALSEAAMAQAGLIAWQGKSSRIAEEFRIIQGQVLQTMLAADRGPGERRGGLSNLVMVTSTRPGEGKSFSALNLAAGIARYGQRRVLLIDADAKPHSLSRQLGLGEAPGLLDLAQDAQRRADGFAFPTALPALFILPIGGSGEASVDRPSLPVASVIEEIGRHHPALLIVIDAPPCLATSDPSNLAPVVGQTVFVIEAGRTKRHEVESALDLVAACPNIALLLNKMQLTASDTFGAYA